MVGCFAGLFLHFIPCLWWTCDWGEHDGESIRGGIWFLTWGSVTVVGSVSNCRRKMEMRRIPKDEGFACHGPIGYKEQV